MRLGGYGWGLVFCVGLMSQAAFAVSLSVSLKNYYAEYEIVLQCKAQAQLSPGDADAAGAAMAKIEAYYLKKDTSLDKDRLLKQAVADKNDSFKIVARSGASGLRPYCRMSLNELLIKAREVDPAGTEQ